MQNINIVYKVDKSEIDRSNASVQQARQLTDQLNQSAKKLGDQGARSNKQFSGSIETVRVKMAQLRAQIEVTNRSDTARMNSLIKQYQQAAKEVDQFNRKLKEQSSAASGATGGINGAAGAFMNMYNAIRLVVGAAVIREFVDTALEAATLAGQVEAVGNAFRRQIPQAEAVLFNLRKATKGTVGDLELMQRALKFQNFGGNVEALPKLLEFASVRAQQTGMSIDYMVNSIVDGIGRKSIRVLDNLGLSATQIKEEMNGISLEAATVAEVSEAMGRVASRELEKMGGFAENSATQVDVLKRSYKDLRIELAKKLDSGALVDFMTQVTDGLKAVVKNASFDLFSLFRGSAKDALMDNIMKNNMDELNRIKKRTIGTDQEKLDLIQQEINSRVQLIGRYNDTLKKIQEEYNLIKQTDPYSNKLDALNAQADAYVNNKVEIQEMIKLLKNYYKTLDAGDEKDKKQIETLKTLNDRLSELKKQREEETSIGNTAELDRLQREINLLEDRILKIGDNIAWQKAWDAASARTALEQWQITEALEAQKKAIDELNTQFNPETKPRIKEDFSDLEVDVEINPTFKLDNEKWVRFRMGLREAFKEAKADMISSGIDDTADILMSTVDIELATYQVRIDNLRQFYANQQELAGDNTRHKKELQIREQREVLKLEKELAIKQKRARLTAIIIDTAASVAKTAAQMGFPAAIPFIALALASGAVQYGIASRAPVGYKEGIIDLKGPGTGTSDSIPARLSKGESVMTAKETKSSMNTLKMIRAKQLDDKVVARLAAKAKGVDSVSVFDDSRMIRVMSEVAKNTASSDLVKKGAFIYDVKKEKESLKTYIRSKSI